MKNLKKPVDAGNQKQNQKLLESLRSDRICGERNRVNVSGRDHFSERDQHSHLSGFGCFPAEVILGIRENQQVIPSCSVRSALTLTSQLPMPILPGFPRNARVWINVPDVGSLFMLQRKYSELGSRGTRIVSDVQSAGRAWRRPLAEKVGEIYCKNCCAKNIGPKGLGFGQAAGSLIHTQLQTFLSKFKN
ncbi:uncharacterized protein LOC125485361 isoform X1 [Rhincodon typus]|uniref:uncharacterized protein LOC125485361 isoform X1 n=1 Tax=Rhincodon typus TaxID=259920 RepID=UPI002030F437|nr:uncharacterized protein LOC125485361 isoform X1 [Rhincodon typus]